MYRVVHEVELKVCAKNIYVCGLQCYLYMSAVWADEKAELYPSPSKIFIVILMSWLNLNLHEFCYLLNFSTAFFLYQMLI